MNKHIFYYTLAIAVSGWASYQAGGKVAAIKYSAQTPECQNIAAATTDVELVLDAGEPLGETQRSLDKAAAEQWLVEFRTLRDQVTDALVVSNLEQLNSQRVKIDAITQKAEKIFGPFSHCHHAAGQLDIVWNGEQMLILNPIDNPAMSLSLATKSAWEGGQWYSECRNFIDGLK